MKLLPTAKKHLTLGYDKMRSSKKNGFKILNEGERQATLED